MVFQSPGYLAFSFLSFDVHWYGIIMAFAILCGIFAVIGVKNKFYKEFSIDSICDISLVLIIWGIIFARLYYVFLDYDYFSMHPQKIFAIWNGGISIQGAIIGGIIGLYEYCLLNDVDFFRCADLLSFGVIVGQIVGRWGNFFNSEAFGLPCNLPWKLYIPYQFRPLEYKGFEYFHPTFLYESLLNIFVLLILLFVLYKFPNRKNGLIFALYLILYSIVRLFIETLRVDSVLSFGIFHVAHIASLVFILVALFILFFIYKKTEC